MTNPERHSEIDTVEDLVNTNSTIYTFHQFYHGILREILKTNLQSSEMAKTFSQKPFVLSDMSLESILAAGRRFGSLAILIEAQQWKGIRSRQPLGLWMRSMREEHLFSVGFSFTLRYFPFGALLGTAYFRAMWIPRCSLLILLMTSFLLSGESDGAPPTHPYLHPSPPRYPPPEPALDLLERGWSPRVGRGVVAVAVVDLGDGERWLSPLHRRAGLPVLLWRAPQLSRRTSAPRWLHSLRGYVLAAKSFTRLHEFITDDTQDVFFLDSKWGEPNGFNVSLQLSSSAPIIVSLSENEFRSNENIRKRPTIQETTVLKNLEMHHRSFRSVVVREGEKGMGFSFVAQDSPTSIFYFSSRANNMIRLFDLMQRHVRRTIYINYICKTCYELKEYKGMLFSSKEIETVRILEQYLECEVEVPKALLDLLKTRRSTSTSLDETQLFANTIIQLFRNGSGDLILDQAQMVEQTESSVLSVLAASPDFLQLVMLVPHAPLLPQWSLPFRAFDAEMWAILLVLVLVYAVTWRVVSGEPFAASVAASLRALSSCGSPLQERITAAPQRLQLAGALLASGVVIVSVYQGRLSSLMTNPERYAEIDTLEDLVKTNRTIYTFHPFVYDIFVESLRNDLPNNEMVEKFVNRPYLVSKIDAKQIVSGWKDFKSLAIISYKYKWNRLTRTTPIDIWLRSMKREIRDCLGFSATARNWPWHNNVNEMLLYFETYGLTKHWSDVFSHFFEYVEERKKGEEMRRFRVFDEVCERKGYGGPQKLKIGDTLVAFEALGFGLIISVFIFMREKFMKRDFSSSPHILNFIFTKLKKG